MPAQAEAMVKAIKEELKKKYPKMKDETIESKAYAITTQIYKKKGLPLPFNRR